METADIILKSNAIFTGLGEAPFPGFVAIKGNKICAVGRESQFEHLSGPEAKCLDYQDHLILPGFVDAHVHYFMGAIAASEHMCSEITYSSSEAECVQMVEAYAKLHPEKKRIIGIGWFPANWGDAPLPTCTSLDRVFPDIPVYLISADVHTFWLNTRALAEAGISGDEILESGEIGKFEDGRLNGLLFEPEAFLPAMDQVMDLPKDQMKQLQKDFFRYINSCGVTSVSEMSADRICDATRNTYRVIREMEAEGELTLRIHIYPALGTEPDYENAVKLRDEFCSEKLRISGLKQFVDGVTSTHTAYLLEPYEDAPDTAGKPIYSKEVLERCTIRANREGFGVRFHAIGDGAVRMALDIFEASNLVNENPGNERKLRNTIEHCETIHPFDLPRFEKLGVVASMQPYHLIQDSGEKLLRMGVERSKTEWPHRSLLTSGAMLAFGTDYPVVDFNPFPSIYAAVTRCDDDGRPSGVNPEEAITLAAALRAYTYGGAFVYGREEELGTLEEGKLADIAVLSRDLFTIPSEEIKECKVVLTVMDGKIVYDMEHETR
ncbi:MAG: Amidohydrolase 3 [Bacillota bacterium]|jgi:predicted amidohydrolase YtcJ|nr:Amidohydrolase 3 [Bacillota bacterium]